MPYYPPTGDAATSLTAYSLLGNTTGQTAAGTSVQSLVLGTPGVVLTGGTVLGQLTMASASFAEFDIQNTTAGATSSTDFVVNADNATATTNYGNFGINSSAFTGSGSLNKAGATYLTATSGDLVIGTTTNNVIRFVVNNGATDALTISTAGATTFNQTVTFADGTIFAASGPDFANNTISRTAKLRFNNLNDASITSGATATIQLGNGDIDTAPIAQTLRSQGALAGGTSNVAGANLSLIVSPGKGTGVGGSLFVQTTPAGSTGTVVGTPTTRLTVDGPGNVVVGSAALATNVTDGFLYIPTCAGTPNGTPTTYTGRVALIYDTTAHQFWIFDTAWKQPKTPAGAAIVTWQ